MSVAPSGSPTGRPRAPAVRRGRLVGWPDYGRIPAGSTSRTGVSPAWNASWLASPPGLPRPRALRRACARAVAVEERLRGRTGVRGLGDPAVEHVRVLRGEDL